MLYTLENETLCVLVRSHGAELRDMQRLILSVWFWFAS